MINPSLLLGSSEKLVQAIDSQYWERKAEITPREPPSKQKTDPKSEPKAAQKPWTTLSRGQGTPKAPRAAPRYKPGNSGKMGS